MKKKFGEIFSPNDLKMLELSDLSDFSKFLRSELIEQVEKTGGHLGSGLGVIELTIALHYVFKAPKDKIIWDTGHQTYPHKMLTNRKLLMNSIRKFGGISGFTKISESEYDCFGSGHSSNSISVVSAFVQSRKYKNENFDIIAIIGDGAISAGLAYEGLNNLGSFKEECIVVLNDNKMSITESVGAMQNHINSITDIQIIRISDHRELLEVNDDKDSDFLEKLENLMQNKSNIFSNLGFRYIGPICGHDVLGLVFLFRYIKHKKRYSKDVSPILLHIVTNKGYGYSSKSIDSNDGYHSIVSYNTSTILQSEKIERKKITQSFTSACIEELNILASNDNSVIAVTAAMLSGTGLNKFLFKDRVFDVGIAEQHAVVFSAGMALEGFNVFCFIYSTFLQRAYDQVINDVAIQNLPVKFVLDRAGVVGPDGETHTGYFDLSFLNSIPNFVILVPSCIEEVKLMTNFLYHYNMSPIAMRIPKMDYEVLNEDKVFEPIVLGKSRVVIEDGYDILFICIGHCVNDVLNVKEMLNVIDTHITIIDLRFAKPIDKEVILYYTLEKGIKNIVVIEHGVSTAIGMSILNLLNMNLNSQEFCFEHICFPDKFIQHGDFDSIYNMLELNARGIFNRIKHFCKSYQSS